MISDYPVLGRLLLRLPGLVAVSAVGVAIAAWWFLSSGLGGAEWGSPWALAAVPLVLFLPVQRLLTGQNRLAVPRIAKRKWTVRAFLAWIPESLQIAGLLLILLALARPQHTRRDDIVESNGLDIMLVMDTSGSMRQQDMATGGGYASRMAVAKAVAQSFVKGRPYDRVGVVAFGEEAFTFVPLTLDHDTLDDALEQLDIGVAGSRGTAVGTAIAVAAKRMKELDAPERIVILVTDGRSNAGRLSPHEAAVAAAALHIRIFTIGVGAVNNGFMGMGSDGVDEPMMRDVAALTNGQYFRASSLSSLQSIYQQIDQLTTSPAKVKQLVHHDEFFARLLVPGMVMVALAMLLWATLLRRSP
jgi:Ca-activated chloride channel family protein